ncbi:MAG: hypothetical protein AAFU85_00040 [Planctomycetota bacterium]
MNESENERPDSHPQSSPDDRSEQTEIADEATTDAQVDEETVFVAKLVSESVDKADADVDLFAETDTLDPESLDAPLETVASDDAVPTPAPAPSNDQPIREGSPFRTEPAAILAEQFASGEGAYIDLGPYRYTAMGAAVSAVLITMFAGLGAWWFPAGGVLVAMLGALLSIVGMYSPNRLRLVAIGALVLHSGLFLFSYQRAIG